MATPEKTNVQASTTEQVTAATKRMGDQARSTAEQFSTASEQTFVPLIRSYGAWMDTAAKVQAEALRFILDRMRKSLEMPARLAECKGPNEVFEVQADFTKTMVSDYVAESEKLLSLSLEGFRHSTEEATRMTEAVSLERTRRAA